MKLSRPGSLPLEPVESLQAVNPPSASVESNSKLAELRHENPFGYRVMFL